MGKMREIFSFINPLTVKTVLTLVRLLTTLILFIHIAACVYIRIGDNLETGWLKSDPGFNEHPHKYYNAYVTALYFTIASMTTVGYGDFNGSTSSIEMVFSMIIELLGVVVFTTVMGSLMNIGSSKTLNQIIQEKKCEAL